MEQPEGPAFARRKVEMCFLIDVSGSMATDGKIQSLNTAVEEALPFFRRTAEESVGIDPFVRVLTFGSEVAWQGPAAPLADYWWHPVEAQRNGLTELGPAIALFIAALDTEQPVAPPPIILLTDGMPTDIGAPSFDEALADLDAHPIGRSCARVAVGIGRDADQETLNAFVATAGGQVLSAQDPQRLAAQIRIAGSSVMRSASEPIW